MKKLITLLLAAGLLVSVSAPAVAFEIKPSLNMDFYFEVFDGFEPAMDNSGRGGGNHFVARQRIWTNFEFIASPSLSAMIGFSAKHSLIDPFVIWGTQGMIPGGLIDFGIRFAYVDWVIPNTSVKIRMGQQPALIIPSYTGMGISLFDSLSTHEVGVSISAPFGDTFTINAGWFRKKSDSGEAKAEHDLFLASVPLSFDGINFVPWLGLELIGARAGANINPSLRYPDLPPASYRPYDVGHSMDADGLFFAGGASFRMTMFDPFTFALNAGYTTVTYDDAAINRYNKDSKRAGWSVSALASYKTDWGVPTVKAWYSSGNSKNTPENEDRQHISQGPFTSGANSFHAPSPIGTNLGGSGANTLNFDQAGSTGVSLQWNAISFIDKLFHNLSATYIMGTNAPETLGRVYLANPTDPTTNYTSKLAASTYMTTDDWAVEIGLQNMYTIYKGLSMIVEASYIFVNFDDVARKAQPNNADWVFDNSCRLGIAFQYTF